MIQEKDYKAIEKLLVLERKNLDFCSENIEILKQSDPNNKSLPIIEPMLASLKTSIKVNGALLEAVHHLYSEIEKTSKQ